MEPRVATRRRSGTLLLLLAAVLAVAAGASASAIGDKCAACKAVAVSSSPDLLFLPSFSLSLSLSVPSFQVSISSLYRSPGSDFPEICCRRCGILKVCCFSGSVCFSRGSDVSFGLVFAG